MKGIEPSTLRMRTVRSAEGERNMPLKKCRKRQIKYRKRKGNVRISQPKERQGEQHDSLSLPFSDSDKNLWCETHMPAERFASQVYFSECDYGAVHCVCLSEDNTVRHFSYILLFKKTWSASVSSTVQEAPYLNCIMKYSIVKHIILYADFSYFVLHWPVCPV